MTFEDDHEIAITTETFAPVADEKHLWMMLENVLNMLVGSIIDDGIIDASEMNMIMSALGRLGIEDTNAVRGMVMKYLQQEMAEYQVVHQHDNEMQKQERQRKAEEFKAMMRRKLRKSDIYKEIDSSLREKIPGANGQTWLERISSNIAEITGLEAKKTGAGFVFAINQERLEKNLSSGKMH